MNEFTEKTKNNVSGWFRYLSIEDVVRMKAIIRQEEQILLPSIDTFVGSLLSVYAKV